MAESREARETILGRIRAQLGGSADRRAAAEQYRDLPRTYVQRGSLAPGAVAALLIERLVDYDAEVLEIAHAEIAPSIAAVLSRHDERVLLVPHLLPPEWLPAGIEVVRDAPPGEDSVALEQMTRADAVLTPCAGAIAETGTILLVHGADQGRRALTLLPDHHLCVVRRDQVVETVAEGLALRGLAGSAPVTTISGPSATADIEMTRIRGVHGPRRLTVLLVD